MRNAVIFHGTDAGPDSNWFGWLKDELEILGYEVWLPQLPNWGAPNTKMMFQEVAKSNFFFNEETILIGHSSGAVALMHLLPKLAIPVRATYLVSAFKDDLGWVNLKALFDRPIDILGVREHTDKLVFIHSNDDPYVPLDHAQYLADNTGGELIIIEGQGHFNTEKSPDFHQFPALLGKIKADAEAYYSETQ